MCCCLPACLEGESACEPGSMSLRGDAALSAVTALTYIAFSTTNPLELVFEPAAPGELDDINMLARGLIVLLFLLITWPTATPLFGVPLSLAALGQHKLEYTAVTAVIAIVMARRLYVSMSAPKPKSSADLGIAGAAAPGTPAKLVSPAMVAATSSPQLVLKSMKEAQQLREEQQREAALKQQEQQVKLQQQQQKQQQQQQQQQRANQTPVKAATVAQAPAEVRTPVAAKTPGAAKTPSVHSPQVVLDAQAKAAADMKRRLDERLMALKKKGPAPR